MVAITVILAAVIGSFVLGLGKNINQTAPTATIDFSQTAANDATVTLSHDGGDSLKKSEISFQLDDNNGDDGSGLTKTAGDWAAGDSEITAGESVTVSAAPSGNGDDLEAGDVVKIIWTSEDGGTSTVIAKYEVN